MARNINYLKRKLDSHPICWLKKRESWVRELLPLVEEDYQELFKVYLYCSDKDFSADIINQFWSKIIPICPTIEDFQKLYFLVDETHEKALFLKGISLCKTYSNILFIESFFGYKRKDEDLLRAIQAKRDELK
jgi:hypothetical protein